MKNRKMTRHKSNKQTGFSLVEVIIAMVVSTVALLGLVGGELKSLQYANNSYQYTIALIQANNVVENVLNNICELKATPANFNANYIASNFPIDENYTLTLDGVDAGFTENFTIYVSWDDERMSDSDGDLNKVAVNASFPTVESGCSVL